jgi:hypothetical protein
MATATSTEKRRQALEAFDGARTQGVALSEYAKARGLAIGDLRRDRVSASPKTFIEAPRGSRRARSWPFGCRAERVGGSERSFRDQQRSAVSDGVHTWSDN